MAKFKVEIMVDDDDDFIEEEQLIQAIFQSIKMDVAVRVEDFKVERLEDE